MKVTIKEMFCEIMSGLALLLVIVPALDWCDIFTLEEFWQLVTSKIDLVTLTGVIVVAYLAGILLDAFGLIADDWLGLLGKWFGGDEPTDQQSKNFWTKADVHVFAYRNNIWAYYFCYRNLFTLMIPATICWFGTLCHRGNPGLAWIALAVSIVIASILFFAMRTLLNLYYEITRSF